MQKCVFVCSCVRVYNFAFERARALALSFSVSLYLIYDKKPRSLPLAFASLVRFVRSVLGASA